MKRKQLSKEERRGEDAFEAMQKVITGFEIIRNTRINIIQVLLEIYNQQWYKDILGDEEGTWNQFLDQKEVEFTRAEVGKAFRVMKRLVGELEFEPVKLLDVQITRLDDIVRFANTKEEAKELLNKAETLNASDWQKERSILLGKPVIDDGHQHHDEIFKICAECHRKKRLEANNA